MTDFDELFDREFKRGEIKSYEMGTKDSQRERRWAHEDFAVDKVEADRLGISVKEYREMAL